MSDQEAVTIGWATFDADRAIYVGAPTDPYRLLTSWQYWKREAMRYQWQHWNDVHQVVGIDCGSLVAECKKLLDEAQAELDAYVATHSSQPSAQADGTP